MPPRPSIGPGSAGAKRKAEEGGQGTPRGPKTPGKPGLKAAGVELQYEQEQPW